LPFDVDVVLFWIIWGSNPDTCKGFLSSPKYPDWLGGPPSLVFIGCWDSVVRAEWPGHEVNHLPSSSAQVQSGVTPLFPVYAFMEWTGKTLLLWVWYFFRTLIKERELKVFQTRIQRRILGIREMK
jgi:hypothetical protein